MPRPPVILCLLLGCGIIGGFWLTRRGVSPAVPPGPKPLTLESLDLGTHAEEAVTNPPMKQDLAATACGSPSPLAPDDAGPDFKGIAIELVRLRSLQALPMTVELVARKEIENRIAAWMELKFPGDFGLRQGRALAALGAIPQPVDTIALRAAFWSHQIGAWFDEKENRLLLAQKETEGEKENALGLAFMHLFREHGAELFAPEIRTTDEWLARLSLIAGDAAHMRLLHAIAHPRTGGGGGVTEDPDDPSRELPLPLFLRQMDLAAFGAGLDFARGLHALGKIEQINAAYSRPPLTTVELLDASLYLSDTPFNPERIIFADPKLDGAAPIWDDSLGAVALVLYLQQHVPQTVASDLSSAWRGDRLLVFAAKAGGRDHALWQTIWTDADAATAFFKAVQQGLLSRYKGATAADEKADSIYRITRGGRSVILARTHEGRGVSFVDAADARSAEALHRLQLGVAASAK